jgi:hypothetical protein
MVLDKVFFRVGNAGDGMCPAGRAVAEAHALLA